MRSQANFICRCQENSSECKSSSIKPILSEKFYSFRAKPPVPTFQTFNCFFQQCYLHSVPILNPQSTVQITGRYQIQKTRYIYQKNKNSLENFFSIYLFFATLLQRMHVFENTNICVRFIKIVNKTSIPLFSSLFSDTLNQIQG